MAKKKSASPTELDLDSLLGPDPASRVASLERLEAEDPELAVRAAALCLPGCWDKVVGPKACQVLSRSPRDEALDALLTKACEDRNYPYWWDPARDALAQSVHSQATDRLLQVFEETIAPFRTSAKPNHLYSWVQWHTISHLARLLAARPDHERTVPRLAELATTPALFPGPCGPEIRKAAVYGLAERVLDSPEVWMTLVGLVQDGEQEVRKAAASMLGKRVKDSASVMDAVIGMLRDDDREVREIAREKLGAAEAASIRAIPDLLALLEALKTDRHWQAPWERVHLISALEKIGPGDARVVQAFLECVREKKKNWVGPSAASALVQMGPSAYPYLSELITFAKARVARAGSVVRGLAKVDPDGTVIVPFLRELLAHKKIPIQRSAMTELGQLGAKAAPALRELRTLLTDKRLGRNVLDCLRAMNTAARRAVPDVLVTARSHRAWLEQAFGVLVAIDPEGQKAIPGIKGWLKDSSAAVRVLTLKALAVYGPAAKRAAGAIRGCLSDRSKAVRAEAEAALKVIER